MAEQTMAKGYEPAQVEDKWIAYWREQNTFTADPEAPGAAYSIVIPPPNVTGALHIGHALNITLQDILCRFARQKGRKVLWVPGTDHAGIATQNVVERALKAEGVERDDIGREAFIERVWTWREEYGGKILNQIRRLGASVDWSRERFTMDEGLSRAVREVFVTLYEQGLIYKGDYIINWCPRCHTALADLEVEHASKKGALYHIKYPLSGGGHVIVATTRPETMLGDTAVAVHPEDERYTDLIGQEALLPLTDRRIPVIADAYVDKDFGTGCLKVTPAHDMNDFELGRKHDLPLLRVMDGSGTINENAPAAYQGLTREQCREKVVEDLRALDLLVSIEEHDHNVGECYRCKTVIEPYVSPQWFVRAGPLAAEARKAVADGRTEILPGHWTKTYYEWLDNIRDWCISRQIWWGHRIPAWTCAGCGQVIVSREDPTACPYCRASKLERDPDVLDTWFSSALWPFSTLGWPDDTPELRVFYPTSVLVTGFDILFFWVARMMMMGLHFMKQAPFRQVYIHALVRDGEGKKMSKSTGNVIDPLVMMQRYGTDALRFTLTAFAAMGRDIKLSEDRIEGYRHFVNKLWNAARFALMHLPETIPDMCCSGNRDVPHAWILSRLEEVKVAVEEAITGYRFNEAAQELYSFLWHEFCDWYLEMIKPDLTGEDKGRKEVAQKTLWAVLTEYLVLLHPVAPFVTQEIWSQLPGIKEPNLAKMPYPAKRNDRHSLRAQARAGLIQDLVVAVRNFRAELGIAPSLKLTAMVKTASDEDRNTLLGSGELICFLARLTSIDAGPDVAAPKASASAAIGGNALFVPLQGAVDFAGELERLNKELAKLSKDADIIGRKLANDDFVARAPAEVVAKEREKAQALTDKIAKVEELRGRIRDIMGE
jgi:valyl-tRNA synthetase